MRLTLGISPCPNDTFIFDALANGLVDADGLSVEVVHQDVQTLNEWALAGRLDLTKLSYGVLPRVLGTYALLEAGGALGQGVGPLLIARPGTPPIDPARALVAIPGRDTTAHLLFSLAFPEATRKRFLVFSEIEAAVSRGEVDAGVIIHESRFTYAGRGLVRLLDLGEHWETLTGGAPIPLGGIVGRRSLGGPLLRRVDALVRRSLEHARSRGDALSGYVRGHAQELDEAVIRQHIALYVNDFSLGLGGAGHRAVERLLQVWRELNPGEAAPAVDPYAASL
jgi:1,4-dihydroxy-6-naphthoate synthase